MKLAYVPVAQLTPDELEGVRAYKREIARRFRERRKAGIVVERDRLGIGGHKPIAELTPEQAEARRAYFADAQKRWRNASPENATAHREGVLRWHRTHVQERMDYQREYWERLGMKAGEQRRKYTLKKLYGMTHADFDAMHAAQDGRCAICLHEFGQAVPHVDHDHATGQVRGLLCSRCNTALGGFRDDTAILRRAITYLAQATVVAA